jgi:hypothetical protein
MLAPWAVEEMKTADLNDKRLNNRLTIVLSQLGAHPTASIPAACGGWAETTAAYRFFDNEKTTFENILQPHIDCTDTRIASQKVVVVATDTTEVDVTRPQQQVHGAGPLDGSSRCGLFLHEMHAFTPDGTPLGTVQATTWARDEDKPSVSAQTRAERAATPIEEKESFRWLLSMAHAREVADRHPQTQIIYVADSEADIYEVIAEGMKEPRAADWIVRACQDRALVDDTEEPTISQDYLREKVMEEPVLYRQQLKIRGREAKISCEDRGRRQPRKSRDAIVEVRAAQVTLRAPRRKEGQLPNARVSVVMVTEVNPPDNDIPVEWILLTSLPIDTADQVRLVVQYYCIRWMIEVFFRTLKSGCRVEERRFENLDRLLPSLAVYLTVTWRVLYVCRLGRSCPEISCEAVFEPGEWQSVYQVVKREKPPKQPPKLQEMVRMVAQLGGYINRKREDEPGPQTLWLGLQRMHDIALCWQLFGPNAPHPQAAANGETELV